MSDPFIRVDHASVTFAVYTDRSKSIRHSFIAPKVGALFRKGQHEALSLVDALRDVTFELNPGDRLALIGHNGSGKSTLLRMLAGVYAPTAGSIEWQGSRHTIFDLSLAANAEATGIENILALGLLQGRSRREIVAKLDEIITFSGLEEYVNLPVRTYSTGMALRLAFAVTTCWQPEILLIDEVMGAGDAEFLVKAHQRLNEMMAGAGIVVFASHALTGLRQFCNKGLVLHHGGVSFRGTVDEAVAYYEGLLAPAA